jgi:hypothetical protein
VLKSAAFWIGTPKEVTSLALLLPISQHESASIISWQESTIFQVMIDKDQIFHAYEYKEDDQDKGIVIPGISIEIDETTIFDVETVYAPYGALIREGSRLSVAARIHDTHRMARQRIIPLLSGLPPCPEGSKAGFRKWQIVLGEGIEKRVLREFAVEPASGPPR